MRRAALGPGDDGARWSDDGRRHEQDQAAPASRDQGHLSPGKMVGDFVPFYFCARSVMLYLLHRSNHADLSYAGGQAPIVHLVADLKAVVAWAQSVNRLWAFTLSNAGAHYVEFRNDLRQLHEIDWQAVVSADFRQPHVREGKQAEFLLHGAFPWHLVRRIGVHSRSVATQVATLVNAAAHRPTVTVEPSWYY